MDQTANSRPHNVQFQHQYSELLLTTADSDCSATYTMPHQAYASSDGSHATYSTTAAIYHQPNCQCHLTSCQPQQCTSQASYMSVQSASISNSSESSSVSNQMTSSCTKEVWVHKDTEEVKINRLNQPIAWIWCSLSVLLFIFSTLTVTQSSWLENGETGESLGLIKLCKRSELNGGVECRYYSGFSSLQLPSTSWKLTLIFFCIADTLLGLAAVLALGTSLLTASKTRRQISFFTGYVQLFAGELTKQIERLRGSSNSISFRMFYLNLSIGYNHALFRRWVNDKLLG